MANDKKDRCWKTPGMGLNTNNPDSPGVPKDDIDIHEDIRSFDMDKPTEEEEQEEEKDSKGQQPYGQPVEAGLAIRLMKAFWDKWNDTKKKFELSGETFTKEDFLKLLAFAETLISIPDGITFDKSIVLKILSQPGCEGLRCYTALKDDKENFALVLVGVNKHGYDIHYEKSTLSEEKANGTAPFKTVANKSLIGEYGHPPNLTKHEVRAKDDHYVLLRLAEQLP